MTRMRGAGGCGWATAEGARRAVGAHGSWLASCSGQIPNPLGLAHQQGKVGPPDQLKQPSSAARQGWPSHQSRSVQPTEPGQPKLSAQSPKPPRQTGRSASLLARSTAQPNKQLGQDRLACHLTNR
ncbi:hypothetical protein E2562_009285 [Oryza meyeriana var. granulata]|uniref:Uncharacterized protein n=1 Tax=Oryza meyeriana var. granulata TaxID=110450 RepID=A0A6G1EAS2_9ORYZ|nr:hypothetical protein E2562_009285 [Oryza meyeriana var. granulata]